MTAEEFDPIELTCTHCSKLFAFDVDEDGDFVYYTKTEPLQPNEERGIGGLRVTGIADYRAANYGFNSQPEKYQPPENMKPLGSVDEDQLNELVDERIAAIMEDKIQQALNKDYLDRGLTYKQNFNEDD